MDEKYDIIIREEKILELINEIEKKYTLNKEDRNFLQYFCKKIMFLRELYFLNFFFGDLSKKYYIEQIISDNFYLINTFLKADKRYFYLNFRSVIEQFCGLFNNISLSSEKRMIMRNELLEIKDFITINHLKSGINQNLEFDLLDSCYKKACKYVHGSHSVEYLNISFFKEIEEFENLKDNEKRKTKNIMMKDIKNLFNILITLLSYKYSNTLSNLFFRKKETLKYYVGDFCFNIIKKYKTVNIVHKEENSDKIIKNSYIVKNKEDNNFKYEEIFIPDIPKYTLIIKNDFEDKLYSEFDETVYWTWRKVY